MTQPFDNRDWDQRQIAEKDAEIERLNGELLDQTDRRHWLANENESQTKLIAELNTEIKQLKVLLTRAANALEEEFGSPKDPAYGIKGPVHELIDELRKAVG